MLDMWIIALITFCVLLVENVSTLVQAIVKDNGYFLFSIHLITMLVSVSMICTSIIQIVSLC